MSGLDIQHVRQRRAQLEFDIWKALRDFEVSCGVEIRGVDVRTVTITEALAQGPRERRLLTAVRIDVVV